MIDRMIEDLRNEEQEDIQHKDRCENSENANSNEKDDLAHSAGTMKDEIERLEDAKKAMMKALDALDQEEKDLEKQMEERLKLRNEEHEEFKRALEADTNAVKVIEMAQKALSEFFEKTKLLQTASKNVRDAAPPKVAWGDEGGKYGGDKGMNNNAMGALDMIKEDLQKEIKTAKSEDDEDQAKYQKEVAAMEKALKTKKDTIEAIDKQLAELDANLEDKQAAFSQNKKDSEEAEEMTKALKTDCQWVKTHFDKRRKARKAEIAGLEEAKDHLAKAGSGDDDSLDLDDE